MADSGSDAVYLLCALGCVLLFGYKARAWRRAPRDRRPAILPVCASTAFAAVSFAFTAPSVGAWFDRLTGVRSLALLVVFGTSVAFVCACQAMLLYWRYPASRAWPVTRAMMPVYGLVLLVMIALFAIGPVPGEHVIDFPVVYSGTTSLATMMALYFLAYVLGVTNVIRLCWRWSYDAGTAGRPWLRAGLRLSSFGFAFPAAYGTIQFWSVVAMYGGSRVPARLVTTVAPGIASLGVPVLLVGNSIAVWGPRLPVLRDNIRRRFADLRDYRTLYALWRPLSVIDPAMIHQPSSVVDRFRLAPRLLLRVIEINDWLHRLRNHRDSEIMARAARVARDAGLGEDETVALVEAARISAALRQWPNEQRTAEPVEAERPELASFAFAGEQVRLVLVARALRGPLLRQVLRPDREAAAALPG